MFPLASTFVARYVRVVERGLVAMRELNGSRRKSGSAPGWKQEDDSKTVKRSRLPASAVKEMRCAPERHGTCEAMFRCCLFGRWCLRYISSLARAKRWFVKAAEVCSLCACVLPCIVSQQQALCNMAESSQKRSKW